MKAGFLLIVAVAAGLAGCSKKEEPVAAGTGTPVVAPAQAPAPAAAAAPGEQSPNKGKLLQMQQAAGYTYAEVELSTGEKVWMAGGPLDAKVGDVVQWGKPSVMQNFTAKSLGRTFDTILFVGSWGKEGAPMAKLAPHGQPMAGTTPAIDPAMLAPPANKPIVAGGDNSGQVKSVLQATEYTYVEVSQAKGIIWIAGPKTEVKAGDKVAWEGDMVMTNFQSKALNRSFDRIIFASRINVAK